MVFDPKWCPKNEILEKACVRFYRYIKKDLTGMEKRTMQHSTAQHSTAQHSTAQHSTAQHSTAQHSTAQHITVPILASYVFLTVR